FASCDEVRFHIDRAKLAREADNFPGVSSDSGPGVFIPLEEDEQTVLLLFAFAYRDEHVHLEDIEFPRLARLAEATEKYRMARHKIYLVPVMAYAAKHGHMDILDLAAPYSVGQPFSAVHSSLPNKYYVAWV
ncbi:hypothetical protein BD626DRAFT_360604, partial [Schizophyllum amplum]